MLMLPPTEFRKRRGRPNSARPPFALTLVAAMYDPGTSIRLSFDRPIDVAALVGSQIIVDDGVILGIQYEAQGTATMIDPATVEIGLLDVTGSSVPGVRLTAGAANGIVAVDDGGTWAGVSDVPLPFP